MSKEVIIACDFNSQEKALEFLQQFKDEKPYVKVGMEVFYGNGPEIVRQIKKQGHKIFLDLKLHDIPNTVYHAMSMLAELDVDMVNVHAAGTIEMMKAARKALDDHGSKAILLAVTQLTSTTEETVAQYALNAKNAGCDGVVCSPLEVEIVKKVCGEDFQTVTPGIRFATDSKGDQKRVTTPAIAHQLGSDYIVVGRSITRAENPVEAYRLATKQFQTGEE